MTNCDRTGGQFSETLILSVGTQFFCNDTFKHDGQSVYVKYILCINNTVFVSAVLCKHPRY